MTPGSWRRWSLRSMVVRAVAILLLGAVVNVAVAWGCAAFLRVYFVEESVQEASMSETRSDGSFTLWYVSEQSRGGAVFYLSSREIQDDYQSPTEPSPSEIVPLWTGLHLARNGEEIREVIGWGWPYVSLGAEYEPNVKTAAQSPWHVRRGFNVPDLLIDAPKDYNNPYDRAFPVIVAWPGFAINTVFYAAILWLLFAAPGRVRRWRRIRRGLCAKCAYPVGASDVCTECGAAVRRIA